jgi:hypothetical protein
MVSSPVNKLQRPDSKTHKSLRGFDASDDEELPREPPIG